MRLRQQLSCMDPELHAWSLGLHLREHLSCMDPEVHGWSLGVRLSCMDPELHAWTLGLHLSCMDHELHAWSLGVRLRQHLNCIRGWMEAGASCCCLRNHDPAAQDPRSTGANFSKLLQMFCAGNSCNAQAFVAG